MTVLVLLTAPLAATAQPLPDLSKTEIKVTKVAGNVYMLQGSDAGNIAALVGEDGIVLIDDEYAPLATKIASALKSIGITDKPVRFIIEYALSLRSHGWKSRLREPRLDDHRA